MNGVSHKFVLAGVLILTVVFGSKLKFKSEVSMGAVPGRGGNLTQEKNSAPIFVLGGSVPKIIGGDLRNAQIGGVVGQTPVLIEKSFGNMLVNPPIKMPAALSENILSEGLSRLVFPVTNSRTVSTGFIPGNAGNSKNPVIATATVSQGPTGVFVKKSNLPAPNILSREALLADLKTGETYFELNSGRQWPIASISKLITAAVAMKEMDLSQNIALSTDDFLIDDNAINKTLKVGEKINAGDLLKIMLLVSSNEAAEAFARIYGRVNFITLMNAYTKNLGMDSTFFKDPTGLSVSNQSTPRDLRLLALAILEKQPEIFKITQNSKVEFKDVDSGVQKTAININQFVGRANFTGGKTGYIDESGENLLSVFNYDGRQIFVVVLGSGDRFGETEKLLQWFEETYKLNQ